MRQAEKRYHNGIGSRQMVRPSVYTNSPLPSSLVSSTEAVMIPALRSRPINNIQQFMKPVESCDLMSHKYIPKTYQLNRPAGLEMTEVAKSVPIRPSVMSQTYDQSCLEQSLRKTERVSDHSLTTIVLPRLANLNVSTLAPTCMQNTRCTPVLNNTYFTFPGFRRNTLHGVEPSGHSQLFNPCQQNMTCAPQQGSGATECSKMQLYTVPSLQCINNNSRVINPLSDTNINKSIKTEPNYELVQCFTGTQEHKVSEHAAFGEKSGSSVNVHLEQSSIKTEPEENEEIDIETVEERDDQPLLPSLLNKSVVAALKLTGLEGSPGTSEELEVDHLTESINRVARGEFELELPEITPNLSAKSINHFDDTEVDKTVSKDRRHVVDATDDNFMPATNKKRGKTKAKMKVSLMKKLSSSLGKVNPQKAAMTSRYITDPRVGFGPNEGAFTPDRDIVEEVETRKLSSVSGHHLLSLTESEKQYLRNKGYMELQRTHVPPPRPSMEDKTINSKKKKIKKKTKSKNVGNGRVVANSQEVVKATHGQLTPNTGDLVTNSCKSDKTVPYMKTPVVQLTKLEHIKDKAEVEKISVQSTDMQNPFCPQMYYVVSSHDMTKLKPGEMCKDSVEDTTKEAHCSGELKPVNQPVSSCNGTVSHSVTDSAVKECQTDKYIRLGNVSYKVLQNNREKFLIKKRCVTSSPAEVSSTSGVFSNSGVKGGWPLNIQMFNNNVIPANHLLKTDLTAAWSASPNKNLYQKYGGAVNVRLPKKMHPNSDSSKSTDISSSVSWRLPKLASQPASSVSLNQESESRDTDLMNMKSKVRLEIPVRVINPRDVVINKASTVVSSGMSSVNISECAALDKQIANKGVYSPSSKEISKPGCADEQDVAGYKATTPTKSDWRSNTLGQKRKTLPPPKPRDQVLRHVRSKSAWLTERKMFRNGLRKAIKTLLGKSTHPVIKMANSLDLIPTENIIRIIRGANLKNTPTKYAKIIPITNTAHGPNTGSKIRSNSVTRKVPQAEAEPAYQVVTAIQIFKDQNGHCTHSITNINVKIWTGENKELHRWHPFANHPCVLHFSANGIITNIEVESISKGLHVALDSAECYPLKKARKVKTTLSIYPPYVSAIPSDTMALAFGDLSSTGSDETPGPGIADVNNLEQAISKLLGTPAKLVSKTFFDYKYGSETDKMASPRIHSHLFYRKDVSERFENGLLEASDSANEGASNINNNKNKSCGLLTAGGLLKQREGVSPRFSERAMALKIRQNELFETCRQLKRATQLREKRKRKRGDETELNSDNEITLE